MDDTQNGSNRFTPVIPGEAKDLLPPCPRQDARVPPPTIAYDDPRASSRSVSSHSPSPPRSSRAARDNRPGRRSWK